MKDLLTVDQVAERLQVSRWMVYRIMWNCELVSV
jgi:predicted DNA-binding transcriptional regulator AlpA